MKTGIPAFLLTLLFILCLLTPLSADDKPMVAVYPMSNPTDLAWIDNLGNTVEEVVFLSLALMGDYQIIRLDSMPDDFSENNLSSLATENGYDDIIFGECLVTDEGYRFSVSIYDRYKDKITIRTEEDFESVMDSFDAADLLVEALVEGFSGVKVSYGGLSLALSRDETYRTVIDSIDMGEGFSGSDKMVSGTHILEFYQDRGDGEILVSAETVEIPENESVRLNSFIPWLTEKQESEFSDMNREIASLGDDPNRGEIAQPHFEQALEWSGTPWFSQNRPELTDYYKNWKTVYEEQRTDTEGLIPSSSLYSAFPLQTAPFKNLTRGTSEPVSSSLPLFSHMMTDIQSQPQENRTAIIPDHAAIRVDGKADDWKGVSTVFNDETGSLNEWNYLKANDELFEGQDIDWVGIATDGKRIYVAIKTVSGKFIRERNYLARFHGKKNISNLQFDGMDDSFVWHEIPNGSYRDTKGYGPDSSPVRGARGEIIEMSFPLSRLISWNEPVNWTLGVEFIIQRSSDPYMHIDEHTFDCFIPELYYQLKSEEK